MKMTSNERSNSDLDWIYDTENSEDEQSNSTKSKQNRGRPSIHSQYPEIISCVRSFIEQSSAEAHLRRHTSAMHANGVTLNDIMKHVKMTLGLSVSRHTIRRLRLMNPPRKNTTASSKLYNGLVDARVPPKRNTREKSTPASTLATVTSHAATMFSNTATPGKSFETNDNSNDESNHQDLQSLLANIVSDVKEMKADIKFIKSTLGIGKFGEKLDSIETVTNRIEEHLKRRKEKSQRTVPVLLPTPCLNISSSSTLESSIQLHIPLSPSIPVPKLHSPITSIPVPTVDPIPPVISSQSASGEATSHISFLKVDETLDVDNDEPWMSSTARTRRINPCATYIRQQLHTNYQEEELANGRIIGGKRKWKEGIHERETLSPNRLERIVQKARSKFPKELFESMGNLNEIVNSKCRQVRYKLKQRER